MNGSNFEIDLLVDEVVRELKKRMNPLGERGQSIIVIQQFSPEDMARTALLVGGTENSDCILEGLRAGKKIYLLKKGLEYQKSKEQMPKTLYQKYLEYETELLRFGCEIISGMADILPRECVSLPACKSTGNALNLTGHRVIRESDLRRARGSFSSTILIDRGAIVTPLAKDFIDNQNLVIQRE